MLMSSGDQEFRQDRVGPVSLCWGLCREDYTWGLEQLGLEDPLPRWLLQSQVWLDDLLHIVDEFCVTLA